MTHTKIMVDWDVVKADPVEFARQMLTAPDGSRLDPHPAQQEILHSIRRWTTFVTGRQLGKSTVMGVGVGVAFGAPLTPGEATSKRPSSQCVAPHLLTAG